MEWFVYKLIVLREFLISTKYQKLPKKYWQINKTEYNRICKEELWMARPKRFSEKLVVGLTPEIKEFLQKEAEKECCEMNAIVRRAILEYMEKKKDN